MVEISGSKPFGKRVVILEITGIIFTIILSFILHFLFDWSGKEWIASFFSAVNRSVFEHMKLITVPYSFFAAVEYFFLRPKPLFNRERFWTGKMLGIIFVFALNIVSYYTYTGILGFHINFVDIFLAMVSVVFSFLISLRYILTAGRALPKSMAILIILTILAFQLLFTYYPLNINLFRDPVDGGYGIK